MPTPRNKRSASRTRGGIRNMEMSPADLALYEVMQDTPLEPGDMLLLGPKSVRALTVKGAYNGSLPDKFIFKREEWQPVPRRHARTPRKRTY